MRPNTTQIFATLAFSFLLASVASADVQVSKLFGNHMVLQQEQPIRVWGTAAAGEEVTVSIGGNSGNAKAGEDGKWRVDLPAMKADGKAHTMTIKGKNTVELNDVLLGEVWICSGQSNMEWSVTGALNPQQEVAAADHPRIRLFNVGGHVRGPDRTDDPRGAWQICSPQTVGGFSAVGYYFGRALQKELGVPIGLVGTNWGGTRIEPWTPAEGFEQVESLKDYRDSIASVDPSTPQGKAMRENHIKNVENWTGKARQNLEAGKDIGNPPHANFSPKGGAIEIYNGMVYSLIPLSVRGAVWYQGESNAGDGLRYEFLKEALVKGWRTVFENDALAFHWVQLADFQGYNPNPAGGGWGPVREGQRRALRLPHTGMAVIIDVGDPRDIHPKNKQDVGARLARGILHQEYGKTDIVPWGPLYKSMKTDGNKITISFDHVGGGLMLGNKEGLEPTKEIEGGELKEFAIQDAAGAWHWAKAEINADNTVSVWADGVQQPKHVRYAYQSNPENANLYNKEGLPASPFTTVD